MANLVFSYIQSTAQQPSQAVAKPTLSVPAIQANASANGSTSVAAVSSDNSVSPVPVNGQSSAVQSTSPGSRPTSPTASQAVSQEPSTPQPLPSTPLPGGQQFVFQQPSLQQQQQPISTTQLGGVIS